MSRELSVHFLPGLFEPVDLRGGVAVMIDVLRASTTIVHALAAGARAVVPCEQVQQARVLAANRPAEEVLLGGERDGVLIDGFDLDNSPLKYTETTVRGRTVVFTTTNGTRALARSSEADRILIGAFVNLKAVAGMLVADERPIHLVCAGTRGKITAEDVLCAGAIANEVRNAISGANWTDEEARIAVDVYAAHSRDEGTLLDALRESRGGRNLRAGGFDADIERAATWDLFNLVPEYSPGTNQIEAVPPLETGGKRSHGS